MKKLVPEFVFDEEQMERIVALAADVGLTVAATQILYARGIDTPEKVKAFIHPSRKNFLSPMLLAGMKEAVALLKEARDEGWTVAVFGD
ncbi:MAG: hypothetical protein ACI4U2_03445, partial [Christensenellaceae bacterium]